MKLEKRNSRVHLAECLKSKSDLFATGHEYKDFGLKMGLDKTPQKIEFLVEFANSVMLFEILGCRGVSSFFQANGYGAFETQTREVIYGLGLSGGKEKRLPGFRYMGQQRREGF